MLRKSVAAMEAELPILEHKLEGLVSRCGDLETKIEGGKDLIKRLKKDFDLTVTRVETNLLLQKLEARTKMSRAQISGSDSHLRLIQLQFQFDEAGIYVKAAVEKRTELYRELDYQREKLLEMEVEEKERGSELLPHNDPLGFIESKYNFFQDAETCPLENIGNIENPEMCIQAMTHFVFDLYDNIHRFKHMPLGPLFNNCVIKNKKWAPLIEFVLRAYLFSFLVDNIVDGLVFEEIFEKHFPGCNPGDITKEGIVCPKFHVYAFDNSYEPHSRITSITGLDIENLAEGVSFFTDDWMKFLSETIKMEKILLMENENAAFLVMSHIRTTSWHCDLAYTLDGFEVHPFPCFRTKKIEFFSHTIYIQCGVNLELCDLRFLVKRLERRIHAWEATILEKRKEQLGVARELDEVRPVWQKLKAEEMHFRKIIDKLDNELNQPITIANEKKKKNRRQKKLRSLQEKVDKLHGEIKKLKDQIMSRMKPRKRLDFKDVDEHYPKDINHNYPDYSADHNGNYSTDLNKNISLNLNGNHSSDLNDCAAGSKVSSSALNQTC